jgi:hypothetical protein
MNRLLPILALAAALAACGNSKPTSCIETSHCEKGFVCHPQSKICVMGCSASGDCPETAKTCDAIAFGAQPTTKFCQCESTPACKGDDTIICGATERICITRCKSDADCTFGRHCDAAAGQCT